MRYRVVRTAIRYHCSLFCIPYISINSFEVIFNEIKIHHVWRILVGCCFFRIAKCSEHLASPESNWKSEKCARILLSNLGFINFCACLRLACCFFFVFVFVFWSVHALMVLVYYMFCLYRLPTLTPLFMLYRVQAKPTLAGLICINVGTTSNPLRTKLLLDNVVKRLHCLYKPWWMQGARTKKTNAPTDAPSGP